MTGQAESTRKALAELPAQHLGQHARDDSKLTWPSTYKGHPRTSSHGPQAPQPRACRAGRWDGDALVPQASLLTRFFTQALLRAAPHGSHRRSYQLHCFMSSVFLCLALGVLKIQALTHPTRISRCFLSVLGPGSSSLAHLPRSWPGSQASSPSSSASPPTPSPPCCSHPEHFLRSLQGPAP